MPLLSPRLLSSNLSFFTSPFSTLLFRIVTYLPHSFNSEFFHLSYPLLSFLFFSIIHIHLSLLSSPSIPHLSFFRLSFPPPIPSFLLLPLLSYHPLIFFYLYLLSSAPCSTFTSLPLAHIHWQISYCNNSIPNVRSVAAVTNDTRQFLTHWVMTVYCAPVHTYSDTYRTYPGLPGNQIHSMYMYSDIQRPYF